MRRLEKVEIDATQALYDSVLGLTHDADLQPEPYKPKSDLMLKLEVIDKLGEEGVF